MFLIKTVFEKLFSANNIKTLNTIQVRTKVRYHLPNPTEVKRVRKQGFLKRTQTTNGRKLLMERILRGDKVISQ